MIVFIVDIFDYARIRGERPRCEWTRRLLHHHHRRTKKLLDASNGKRGSSVTLQRVHT